MSGRAEAAPALVVLGHVTRDVIDGETRLGGAASFAARAASLLGIDTALVTVAPPDAPELAPLFTLPSLRVAVAPSRVMTTFELEYSNTPHVKAERRLSLLELARPLRLEDVPRAWRSARALYVGPIAGECDAPLVDAFEHSYAMASMQGWLRDPASGGLVRPLELDAARHPPRNLKAACFSVSDHPHAESIAKRLVARGVTVALTRGRGGAHVSWEKQSAWVPAADAREVDPTGAGDVFSLVFGLALWRGIEPLEAARRAAVAAARTVEGPGLGRLEAALHEIAVNA